MRCIKSNRACTGYEEPTPWTFKQYESHGVDLPAPFKSRARKCTLPKRTFIPGSEILMADVDNRGTEVSNEQLLDYAVRAFFYDFCVLPSDPGGSRGYLSNLEKTVNQLGIHSMLGKSCLAISYITHGQALQRPQLVKNAEAVYHEVVGCLAAAITHSGPRITAESKLVAMLLGIYEV